MDAIRVSGQANEFDAAVPILATADSSDSYQLFQLAALAQGNLVGDGSVEIVGCGTLKSARIGEITFLTSSKFDNELANSVAAAVVVPRNYVPASEIPYLQVDDVEVAFSNIVRAFRPEIQRPRIGASSKAFISASAKIADNVSIYPGAFIGDEVEIGPGSTIFPNVCILERCRIGSNVKIYPNATLYEDTIVGDDSTIHAGVVLGCHGFGYNSSASGHQLGRQLGFVEIGSDVELGANSCVDRGTFGATRVETGTRFDNMVQIGHNCMIGEHNLICAQVGIAGSTKTGRFVIIGGQAGIADHVSLGDDVKLGAQTGIMQDVENGQTMIGTPAFPARRTMQSWAIIGRLPELRSEVKSLGRKLESMTTEMQQHTESLSEKIRQLEQKAA